MLIVDSLVAVAPIIAYYSQYSLIKETKSVGSFSIDVCGILIIANIMRIYFWLTSGFAINLLIQSFLVIGMQFLLLDICIQVGYKSKGEENKTGFWRWNKLQKFAIFSIVFALCLGGFTALCHYLQLKHYGTILGLASLSIQATLGIPQLLQNQKAKSVAGLSIFMISTWFIGDFLKTLYFVIECQPFQFILSGSFQLGIDTLILIQIMAFGDGKNYSDVKEYQIQYSNTVK